MMGRRRSKAAGRCVATLVTLALVGCGGSGASTTPTQTASTATQSTPAQSGKGMVVPIEVGLATSSASHGAQLAVGDTLEIRLETEPDSGYVWSLTSKLDKSVMKGSGTSTMLPESPSPGVTSYQVFTFKAVGKGRTSIQMSYAKRSGGKPKHLATFPIQVS